MEIHYIIQHELPDNPPLSVHLESEVEVIDPIEVIDPKAQRNTPEPFFRKTSREHLREARKALTDGYKPNKNPMKTAWGRVFDAGTSFTCHWSEIERIYRSPEPHERGAHKEESNREGIDSAYKPPYDKAARDAGG